jgi:hypothetical protein
MTATGAVDVNIGTDIGYAVGVGGIALTVVQHWTERRRARPVVITNEVEKRTIKEGPKVTVTNDSTVPAFNVRYGVNMGGIYIPWKHSQNDLEASRWNVLPAGQTEPNVGSREIVIPDKVLFALANDRDPDDSRFYWAYYHGPGGDWWYTTNPASRSENLKIQRLRRGALGWRKRKLDRALKKGEKMLSAAIAELQAGAQSESAEPDR